MDFLTTTEGAGTEGDYHYQQPVHRVHKIPSDSVRAMPHDTHSLHRGIATTLTKLASPLWGTSVAPPPQYCHLTCGDHAFPTLVTSHTNSGEVRMGRVTSKPNYHPGPQVSSTCQPTSLHCTPSPLPGPSIKAAPATHAWPLLFP